MKLPGLSAEHILQGTCGTQNLYLNSVMGSLNRGPNLVPSAIPVNYGVDTPVDYGNPGTCECSFADDDCVPQTANCNPPFYPVCWVRRSSDETMRVCRCSCRTQ